MCFRNLLLAPQLYFKYVTLLENQFRTIGFIIDTVPE